MRIPVLPLSAAPAGHCCCWADCLCRLPSLMGPAARCFAPPCCCWPNAARTHMKLCPFHGLAMPPPLLHMGDQAAPLLGGTVARPECGPAVQARVLRPACSELSNASSFRPPLEPLSFPCCAALRPGCSKLPARPLPYSCCLAAALSTATRCLPAVDPQPPQPTACLLAPRLLSLAFPGCSPDSLGLLFHHHP